MQDVFRALGYDGPLEFEDGNGSRTRFRYAQEVDGEPRPASIIVGADIYPGWAVSNPNSAIALTPAIAHEIQHYERAENMRDIEEPELLDIDEAMTSLQAACAHRDHLSRVHIEQLVSDALQRLIDFTTKWRQAQGADR